MQNPGLVWGVADSDGVVFGLDTATGAVRMRIRLPGPVDDPEDLAVGPWPDLSGPCVFVADTGDNDRTRERVAVADRKNRAGFRVRGNPTAIPVRPQAVRLNDGSSR